ncbi:MAG TPA: hypothetical protein VFA20_23595 [Myxococcaceae bacterium]|nr:hypothetical protein [Myxococcaceae bacterium]
MLDAQRRPLGRWRVFALAHGRTLPLAMALLGLSGCLAHQEPSREWLVYAREVPVARVTLAGTSRGNVVDLAVRGGTAEVTLRHQGQATLTLVQSPPGMKVALRAVDVRALARGDFDAVEREVEVAPPGHDDDTAREVLQGTADEELAHALQSERGRRAVARLYSALTDGSIWDDERAQARRVLTAYAQRIGPERLARAVEDEGTKVIPLRGFGATVASPVSLRVELAGDGLDVFVNTKVYAYPEAKTLPLDWLRLHVGYDEVVGVRLYDEGGATRFAPALYLLEVAHQDARRTLLKCGEAFTFGVTLGAGGAVAAAGGRVATALLWCDRAAVALGAVTSVVDEHRAWILEKYGERGARFLRYSDGLSTLVAFYAVGRLATAAPKVLVGLRNAYREMRALKAALSAEDQATLELLGRTTEEALAVVERGADVIPIERARAKPPALQMEPLQIRATGTDGKLVPVGEGQPRPGPVASAGEGGRTKPLRASPPSSVGARATGGRGGGRGGGTEAAAPASAESEITTALMRLRLSEQQARQAAQSAAKNGVVDEVEALVNSPGFKNPENLPKFLNDWNAAEEDVRFDPRSTHPLKGGDRNAVRAAFPDRDRLRGVDRIFITTDRGTFQFDPPFPLH